MMAEPAVEKPTPKPLAIPVPETTSRPLPGGGFLRIVSNSSGPSAPVAPVPTPPGAPAAVPGELVADATGQIDLFSWRPRPARTLPPKGTTLPMFPDLDLTPDHGGEDDDPP